jgi:transcriptional regulator with GAF, ATPase, and Fis domain/CHASE2 domain-containing sensor protein
MAHAAMTPRAAAAVAGAALLTLLVTLLLQGPLTSLENGVTSIRYAVRGERKADTNIVVVYIDDAAIKVTGWPVRHNFHALMLKALTDLHVRAVGIEPVLDDQVDEYPEYDQVLASVMKTSVPVVMTCYFDSLGGSSPVVKTDPPSAAFSFPGVTDPSVHGGGLHLPLTLFTDAAAGVGHVNFSGKGSIPVFVRHGAGVVPSFATELARVSAGLSRDGIQFDGQTVAIRSRNAQIVHDVGANGSVSLLYPGRITSFTALPFLEVLRDYDLERVTESASLPVLRLQNKIVLIGPVASGRGFFVDTPVDPRLPSILVHATALDNALGNRFLTVGGVWSTAMLALVFALLCGVAVLVLPPPWDRIAPGLLALFLLVLSQVMFVSVSTIVPVLVPLLTGMITIATALVVRHRITSGQIDVLAAEKNAVLAELRDREARLAVLERELLDYQTARPADRTQELLEEIRRNKAEIRSLSLKADDMEEYAGEQGGEAPVDFEGMVYRKNGPMRAVADFIGKIAGSDAPVLILGASGTGKERVARAIHNRSQRVAAPFIAVNCGALSESLLESELFGHEKGAFTGAVKDKMGRFELADGGTIFLDEIGEVSEGFQLKLLRVLQEGEVERVGGTRTLRLNVRVVAATNKDLREQVKLKKFREDLYYRLNVLSVSLPALRERSDDIPVLVRHFLAREQGGLQISRNVMEALQQHTWPGNVRELESVIRRGAVMARSENRALIHMKDLPEELAEAIRRSVPVQEQILEMVRESGFSRSSISDTASGLGGLNRGTVAEHLRGEFLKTFAEHQFDLTKAVVHIALSSDPAVNDRVRKRYIEYLSNIVDGIDISQPWESARVRLRSKTRNLPQRYHLYLEQVAEAYFRKIWTLPPTA